MGMPDGGEWLQQRVQQRELRVPVIEHASRAQDSPQAKLVLNLVEFFGPGTILTMIALGAWVMGRRVLGKWLDERGR